MISSLKDLIILDKGKLLGEGAFSKVVKVKNKNDDQIYALKQISLATITEDDLENLKQEIQLHETLKHPNIIRFFHNIQEEEMVYLLLEYAANGALFFFIHSVEGIPEKLAL